MTTAERMKALLGGGHVIKGFVYQDGQRGELWFDGTRKISRLSSLCVPAHIKWFLPIK